MNVRVSTNTENPAGSPTIRPTEASDEFRSFKDLTEKLVQVPKAALDAKRKGKS